MINIFISANETEFILKTCSKIIKNNQIKVSGLTTSHYSKRIEKSLNCIQIIEENLYNANLNNFNPSNTDIELEYSFILEADKEFEVYARSFDRIQPIPLPIIEIKKIYYSQLQFFKNFFVNHNIKFTFFVNSPHFPHSLAIYIVCKILKIKYVIQQRTDINSLYFLRTDLYNFEKKINTISNKNNVNLKIDNYFQNKRVKKTFTDIGIAKNLKIINNYSSSYKKFITVFKSYLLVIKTELINRILNKKKFEINFSSKWGNYNKSNFRITLIKLMRIHQSINLFNYLESICIKPVLNSKYILFALHFQPERSTLPEGRIFDNQILALKILSNNLPNDYKIYVKEHPRQFDLYPQLKNLHYRNKSFYKEIKKLKNIEFINTFTNLNKIMEGATFTASIAGSIGMESIKKNIPCVVFSNTWYQDHPLAHLVINSSDLHNFLNKHINYKKNKKEILENHKIFVNNLNEYLFESTDGKLNVNKDNIEYLSDSLALELINIITD